MTKKKYIHPKAKVIQIKLEGSLQAGSPDDGGTQMNQNNTSSIDVMDDVI